MRNPKTSQDPLRSPLNHYLGTEGNVRVLRVLCLTDGTMGRTTVAEQAELHPTGVRRILDALAEAGLIEVVGSGRNQAVHLRIEHPMAVPLKQLFREEREAFERVTAAVRNAISAMSKPIDAVWFENLSNQLHGVVHVGVLAPPDVVDSATRDLETHLSPLAESLAIHFVTHGYTAPDAEFVQEEQRDRLSDVTVVYGWIPWQWRKEGGGPIRSHHELDERAHRLASAIAERLPSDPSIVPRAVAWLDQQLKSATGREAPALKEWRNMLTHLSTAQIQKILTEDSERARDLRQSLPFAEALSAEERRKTLRRTDGQ
jgi:hypothetical protein